MTYKVTVDTIDETFENTFTTALAARDFLNDIEYSKELARVSNNPLIILPTHKITQVSYDGDFVELNKIADAEEDAAWEAKIEKHKTEVKVG